VKALIFLLLVTVGHAAEIKPPYTTLTLKNGKVFRSVQITGETDDAIYVRYNAGMVKILKSDLSAEMQQRYPTPEQRARAEAEQQQKDSAQVDAERNAITEENIARIKKDHANLIAKITKPAPAERELVGTNTPITWNLGYDEAGRNLFFTSKQKPASPGTPETRFVFELTAEDFSALVTLVRKFEDWCAICSQENPKPTVEKVLGKLGSTECTFRYGRKSGGSLWIGNAPLQEEDARNFLALATTEQQLSAENREIQAKNASVAERLK